MLFVTSTSQATTHGVYAIERPPPAVIRPVGTSTAAIVDQFPWGPDGAVYTVEDPSDFGKKFAPAGMSRTGGGYMAISGKAWPVLKVVRVLGTSAAKATATFPDAVPANIIVVTLKYKGAAGNSVTGTVSNATDGNSNHFNLSVTISGASGVTTDLFENLNYSGTGADSTPSFTNTILTGAISKSNAGRPVNGTVTFSSGADGTIDSAAYVGTAGSTDKGIALLEGDPSVDFVFTGDPGNSLRAAVNAGLVAHAELMTDRMVFVNGNSGLSLSSVQTDVASYSSLYACYCDNWAYQRDDVDGTQRLVGPAPFAVSLACNLSPSTSFSWKSKTAQAYLKAIVSLETSRGPSGKYTNEQKGICTLQAEQNGGFTFESAVVTAAPSSPSKRKYKRTRMGIYIAKSVIASLRDNVDAPNVPIIQQDEVNAVQAFMEGLKQNATTNPISLPHIVDYGMRSLSTYNSAADLAQDQFTIPVDVQISSDQSRIFLSLNYGESVTVSTEL